MPSCIPLHSTCCKQISGHAKQRAMSFLALLKADEATLIRQAKRLTKKRQSLARQVFTEDVDGWTPIHACALRGSKTLLKILLCAGIDVNTKMGQPEGLPDGCAAIHLAAVRGDWNVIKVLLEKGADINAKDTCGRTPVTYAAYRKHRRIVRLLQEHGADMSMCEYPANYKETDNCTECITPQQGNMKFCFF